MRERYDSFPDDHVGPNPEPTIREAFLRFDQENPHVYRNLRRLVRRARLRGASRVGVGMLFEVLRWNHLLQTHGDDFKLNNNYRSYYARVLMELEHVDVFETRRLHGPDLTADDFEILEARHREL